MSDKAQNALRHLIDTIEATGGVVADYGGNYVPKADEDWLDLGNAYILACEAAGVIPLIGGSRNVARRATAPHERCKQSRVCLEHANNSDISSCKNRGKKRKLS